MGEVSIDDIADALRTMGAVLADSGRPADGNAAAEAARRAHDAESPLTVAR
jgi:hypothetical protein